MHARAIVCAARQLACNRLPQGHQTRKAGKTPATTSFKRFISGSTWNQISAKPKTMWDMAKEEQEEAGIQDPFQEQEYDETAERKFEEAKELNDQGHMYQANELHDEALASYNAALELIEGVLGEEHVELASLLCNIGSIYQTFKDFPSAEQHFQRALDIRRKHYGDYHFAVVSVLVKMAVVLLLKGDLDHAEDLLHNSNSILNKIHMDETVRLNSKDAKTSAAKDKLAMIDAERGQVANYLGTINYKRQNWAAAEKNFFQSLEYFLTAVDRLEHLVDSVQKVNENLVNVLKKLNKLDEAKNQCRQTAEILERKGANAQQSLVDVLVLHSSLHEITGTIDQAEEILLKALKVAIEAFGKVSDEVDEIELSLKNIRRRRRESAR